MQIGIYIDKETNIINGMSIPVTDGSIPVEVDSPDSIHFGMAKYIDGKIINPTKKEIEAEEKRIKELNKPYDYENKIIELIRNRYSINRELAILRQRDTKPEEYEEYNAYVEQCKATAKVEIYNNEE